MKKAYYCFLVILSLGLTACSGTGDWTYELPNGYEVWRVNSNEILIKYTESETEGEGIPSFVKEFSYDERYVFSRNVEDIDNNNVLDEIYYALDTKEKELHGPFANIEELQSEITTWGAELPDKWYRTSSKPKG